MPIYEYQCKKCGHQFEFLVLRTSPAAQCPKCKKKSLKQLISLCGMSTESTRAANLSAGHRAAGAVYKDKQREEHKHLHHHYEH